MSASKLVKSPNAFRTISEVSDGIGIPQHVLRFWESKFSQIKPMKRGGGRRYYRPEDVEIIDAIRKLLHDDGYTIKGAQKLLREQGVKAVVQQTYAIQNSNQDEKLKKSIGVVLTNTEEISLNSIRDGLKAISDKLKNR
ncbi:MAG: MerR family transcriptional regulator [Kordiimonadaceae bacterium]|jgi:DNA-binding transcriptional MerR regulator|nr:MerR family transcriptional regulator [Kordiimonadaceae bacterium]MBT7604904.1 MerR family transcriptional regulator [Kordiimonadaceae bacterium]MDC0111489.1 MerR family transcriptional regulator [Emcibacteraceae bacterium]|tara:strand:- start:21495 stop:21911 length:417 start_codon:yes stop_codon:yes gene_type:complete